MRSALSVTVEPHRGYLVIAADGELDLAGATALSPLLAGAIRSPATVAVDLRTTTFMDSAGLRMLLESDRRSRRIGRRMQLIAGERDLPVLRVTDARSLFSWMSPEQLH